MLYVYYLRFQFDLTLKASVNYWLNSALYILVLTLNIRQFHKTHLNLFGLFKLFNYVYWLKGRIDIGKRISC